MSTSSLRIRRQLTTQGWSVFDSAAAGETQFIVREFGSILERRRVGHAPDPRARLVEDEDMRLHSADPLVRWISWHCLEEALEGRAILLRDVALTIPCLPPETKAALADIWMGTSSWLGGVAEVCPVLHPDQGRPRLFFTPWNWRAGANEHLDCLVDQLRAIPVARVHLRVGQALLVDNSRCLHGFEPCTGPGAGLFHRLLLDGRGRGGLGG